MVEPKRQQERRILVVDDDEWIVKMIRLVLVQLKGRNYKIITAASGLDALAQASMEHPHLILMDVVLPDIDGWDITSQLRQKQAFAFVPILLLTSRDTPEDRLQSLRSGADDVMVKPFVPEMLDQRVAAALERYEQMKHALLREAGIPRIEAEPGLQGSISQLSLASLLNFLQIERRSGALKVTGAQSGQVASLFVRHGSIVTARIERRDDLRNEEAIMSILQWKRGNFQFWEEQIGVVAEVQASTSHLLFESVAQEGDDL